MADLADLAERIKAMSPPDRLRLAALLIERGQHSLAHSVAQGVATELGAALALTELKDGSSGKRVANG